MKIIDRYVLGAFIKNYLVTLFVLIGMYIAIDLVFNFGSLTQGPNGGNRLTTMQFLWNIGEFYFYQAFVFFVQLSGMIAAVAASFTLMRLSQCNEMTALLAAGMPLLRVATSVILAGVALNLMLLPIDQEILIPRMIPKLIRQHVDVNQATIRSYPVDMMMDGHDGLFNAARYTPPTTTSPARIDELDVIERNDQLLPVRHISARSAVWNDSLKQWDLTDGVSAEINPPDHSPDQSPNASETPLASYRSDINPEEIALNLGKDYIQLLPIGKINQLLARSARYGVVNLLRTKHARWAQPIVNVILLLLAISAVLTRQPEELKRAAFKSLLLSTLCLAVGFLSYQMAGSPPSPNLANVWAATMAWLPIFLFAPLAVYLLDHIRS